jgi:hypothetical protein
MCHVVNLVVQAILAALGEADDPDEVDYYTLNKEQPLHLDISADPDQVELDAEEFQDEEVVNDEDEVAPEENIILEEEEKQKATESPLSKVCISSYDNIFWPSNVYVSYATSPTRLFQRLSAGRSFGNVQSQNTSRKTQTAWTDGRRWQSFGMSAHVGTTRMQ